MIQKSFIALIALILLPGCTTHNYSNTYSTGARSESIDDGAIGYSILTTRKNNKIFEIDFLVAEQDIPDCKNSLLVHVTYDGFSERTPTENIWMKFELLEENGKVLVIDVKANALSEKLIQTLNDGSNGLKIHNSRDFIIKKTDYKKLSNSKMIKYQLNTDTFSVSGEFPQESLIDLKKHAPKLLVSKCYKGQTLEEYKQELKKGFVDLEVLKAGASKADIERHFSRKFKNRVKDPDTGAYEEIVMLKAFGTGIGPIIIGFDENNKLVYTRDPFNKTRIIYL